jgi:NTP pyrophosphatase (non-canonical NTP hydrolase)
MNPFKKLTQKIIQFRDNRDWKQFHNPKDVALSLVLEATEVLEHFQWKNGKDLEEYVSKNKEEISEEIADVLYWILLISHDLDIDIKKALERKLEINDKKYPVEKAKGKSTKYNKL